MSRPPPIWRRGSFWTQLVNSECFLPQTKMPKINLTTSPRTRYLLTMLQVTCLRKIIKPHRKLQWPIKPPVVCEQSPSLGQEVKFIKLARMVELVFLWQHSGLTEPTTYLFLSHTLLPYLSSIFHSKLKCNINN